MVISKAKADGFVDGDCALLMGIAAAPSPPARASYLLDCLSQERPVCLQLRLQAIKLVEQLCISAYAVHDRVQAVQAEAEQALAGDDRAADDGEQDEFESALLLESLTRDESARQSRREACWPQFLPFLKAAYDALMAGIDAFFSSEYRQHALLLLNPHRHSLQAALSTQPAALGEYRHRKRSHRSIREQRLQESQTADAPYRLTAELLLLAVRLCGDIVHLLLSAQPARLTLLSVIRDSGQVQSLAEQEDPHRRCLTASEYCLFRYKPLLLWQALLSSRVQAADRSLQRLLEQQGLRHQLLSASLSALIDPSSSPHLDSLLPAFLSSFLSHPLLRPYQQPPIDVQRCCSDASCLRERRAELLDSLLAGIGLLSAAAEQEQRDALRDIFSAPFFSQLLSYHQSFLSRLHPPPLLTPASSPPPDADARLAQDIGVLYHCVDQLLLHCLPLIHCRHAGDPELLDALLDALYDAVLPPERLRNDPYTPPPRAFPLHQQAALASWRTVVYAVSRLQLDPKALIPACPSHAAAARPQPIRLRTLVATIMHFWGCEQRCPPPTDSAAAQPQPLELLLYWRRLRAHAQGEAPTPPASGRNGNVNAQQQRPPPQSAPPAAPPRAAAPAAAAVPRPQLGAATAPPSIVQPAPSGHGAAAPTRVKREPQQQRLASVAAPARGRADVKVAQRPADPSAVRPADQQQSASGSSRAAQH